MLINRIYLPKIIKEKNLFIIKNHKLNYIKNVLRKKVGDPIIIFNGFGDEYYSYVKEIKKNYLTIVVKKKLIQPKKKFLINICQPLIKKRKFEFILEKANELGVFSFTPLETKYTTKNYLLNSNQDKMIHLEKKIISSCEQNGRNYLMILNKLISLEKFCEAILKISSVKIYLQPFSSNNFFQLFNILKKKSKKNCIKKNKFFLLVGPEGGFCKKEISILKNSGFIEYSLINNILCSETAMLSSIAILSNLLYQL